MKVAALLTCVLAGSAYAEDAPKPVDKRKALTSLVPGIAKGEAQRRLTELGCEPSDQGDWMSCQEDGDPLLATWTLSFAGGKLDRVEYTATVDYDQGRNAQTAEATHLLEKRANELETAASASGGTRQRTKIKSLVTDGHRVNWSATGRRASKLQLAVYQEGGKSDELHLVFEIVGPKAGFQSNGRFTDAPL
jgi:hypothetical protein